MNINQFKRCVLERDFKSNFSLDSHFLNESVQRCAHRKRRCKSKSWCFEPSQPLLGCGTRHNQQQYQCTTGLLICLVSERYVTSVFVVFVYPPHVEYAYIEISIHIYSNKHTVAALYWNTRSSAVRYVSLHCALHTHTEHTSHGIHENRHTYTVKNISFLFVFFLFFFLFFKQNCPK